MNQHERKNPPAWLEKLLRELQPEWDRETIAGDMREEYHDRAASSGSRSAILWYLRQIISFLPRGLVFFFGVHYPIPYLCAFTGLSALWLGAMDIRLHHSVGQLAIAASIFGQAAVTLTALRLRWAWLRYLSAAGCIGMFYLSGKAIAGLIHGYQFEGYILMIALLLALQSLFTITTVPFMRPRNKNA